MDFDVENSVQSMLGFEKRKYEGGKRYESENKVNILNVDPILLHCDVIKSSRVNSVLKAIIYNFFPNVSPGEKIISEPQHLIYVPLTMNVISSMTVWVTDQDQNLLDLRGQQLRLTFHIRKRR